MLYLVDANNLFYKAYYCNNSKSVLEVKKRFFSLIKHVTKRFDVSYYKKVYVIWDSNWAIWRKELYYNYKANRNDWYDSDECKNMQEVKKVIRNWLDTKSPLKQIMLNGFECDDIIADIVRKKIKNKSKEPITIISSDSDFIQLLRCKHPVVIIRYVGSQPKTKKKFGSKVKDKYYNCKDFFKEYGFKPELYSDVKTLSGDTSDNVPGVNGIGEKRAIEIIREYGKISDWLHKVYNDGSNVSKWAFKARLKFKDVNLYYRLVDLKKNHSGKEINYIKNVYGDVTI